MVNIFTDTIKEVIIKIKWYTPVQYTFGTLINYNAPSITVHQNTDQQFKYIACKWTYNNDDADEESEYSYISYKSIYHPILQLLLEDVVPSRPTTHGKFMLLDCCYYVNKLYNYDTNENTIEI